METNIQINDNLREIDEALKLADSSLTKERTKVSYISSLLRRMGGAILLSAALAFLLQQWGDLGHLSRYFSFLGFTVMLSVLGFVCGLGIKEDKGARTFLAIAAAIIPVHFCQLGAMLYSCFGPALGLSYPSYAYWHVTDPLLTLSTALAGILCLAPIAYISFKALVRQNARELTLAFLATNAVLLIPNRNSDVIAVLALVQFIGMLSFDFKYVQSSSALRTKEGTFVRLMLKLPFVILLARTLHLYQISTLFVSSIFASFAVLAFYFIPKFTKDRGIAVVSQTLSTIPAFISWGLLVFDVQRNLNLVHECFLPLLSLPFSGLLLIASCYCVTDGRGFRKTACIFLLGSLTMQLMIFGGILASLSLILTAVCLAVFGYVDQDRTVFIGGCLGLPIGLLYHIRSAIELCSLSPWVSLALIGMITVVLSSYVERNYRNIVGKFLKLSQTVKTWN